MFIKFFEAKQAGNEKLAQFYADRLPSQAKLALLAWWNTNPLDNSRAPSTPFDMDEYKKLQLDSISKADEQQAATIGEKAGAAGRNSDTYVLLTVLFASVLFFGGVGNTFEIAPAAADDDLYFAGALSRHVCHPGVHAHPMGTVDSRLNVGRPIRSR